MYNEATLKYLESKMPHLFIDGKLINPDNLPINARCYVDSFIAGQQSVLNPDIQTTEYYPKWLTENLLKFSKTVWNSEAKDAHLYAVKILSEVGIANKEEIWSLKNYKELLQK